MKNRHGTALMIRKDLGEVVPVKSLPGLLGMKMINHKIVVFCAYVQTQTSFKRTKESDVVMGIEQLVKTQERLIVLGDFNKASEP